MSLWYKYFDSTKKIDISLSCSLYCWQVLPWLTHNMCKGMQHVEGAGLITVVEGAGLVMVASDVFFVHLHSTWYRDMCTHWYNLQMCLKQRSMYRWCNTQNSTEKIATLQCHTLTHSKNKQTSKQAQAVLLNLSSHSQWLWGISEHVCWVVWRPGGPEFASDITCSVLNASKQTHMHAQPSTQEDTNAHVCSAGQMHAQLFICTKTCWHMPSF